MTSVSLRVAQIFWWQLWGKLFSKYDQVGDYASSVIFFVISINPARRVSSLYVNCVPC